MNSSLFWTVLNCYRDFSFLRILNIVDSNGTEAALFRDETGKYSFKLEPGQLYFLDTLQYVPWVKDEKESLYEPYDVELKSESDEVQILRKTQRVVGKYDLLRFIFKTPVGYGSKHTFLELDDKQSAQSAKFGLGAFFLPIQIRPPLWMRCLRWFRISLGVLATVIFLFGAEAISKKLAIASDSVKIIALFVLIVVSGKWDEVMISSIKDTTKKYVSG